MTLDEIAKRYGLTGSSSVSRIIGLLDQPQPIQDLLSRDKIGEGHVRYLSKIKDLSARSKWAKRAAEGGWTVKETEKRVSQILAKAHKVPAKSRTEPAPTQEYDYNGFHCALVGDQVIISGRNFNTTKDVPAQFIADYGSALECFLRDISAANPIDAASDSSEPELPPPASRAPSDLKESTDQPVPISDAGAAPVRAASDTNAAVDVAREAAPGIEPEGQDLKNAFAELANVLGLTEGPKKEGEGLGLNQLIDLLKSPKAR